MDKKVRTLKVFLVEDSALLRKRLEAMLTGLPGTEVVGHAAEAAAAVSGILEALPDVVVLDIQLEKGNGFDVLRGLAGRAPQVRVYLLTNFANEAYRAAAERLGASGFFDKSNDIERLREALAAAAAAL